MNNVIYRLASNNEHDGLAFCNLYNSFYAKGVGLSYYRWQFFDTPFPSLMCLAVVNNNKPIGFYGLHILESNIDSALTAWVLDIMIAPAYQNRGIFRRLAQFAKTQLSAYQPAGVFVMANPMGANAHIYGMGWRQINIFLNYVAQTMPMMSIRGDSLTFEEVWSVPDLQKRVPSHAKTCRTLFTVRRDEAYTHWRFTKNPRFRYAQFKVLKRGGLFGYLVLKTFKDPKTANLYGDIVDLAWTEDDPQSVANMLRFALTYFHEQGVREALMWLQTNTILDQVGRDVGFIPSEQRRYFCGEILNKQYKWLNEPCNWFTTLSDSEIY